MTTIWYPHLIECNQKLRELGSEGCICVVVNKNEYARLLETEHKLDEWYRLEARLHAAIHRHGGGPAIRDAIAELGANIREHNPMLAHES